MMQTLKDIDRLFEQMDITTAAAEARKLTGKELEKAKVKYPAFFPPEQPVES